MKRRFEPFTTEQQGESPPVLRAIALQALLFLSLLLGVVGCYDEFNVPTCSTLADCPEGAVACHNKIK